MSLQTHTVTIKRETETQGSSGGSTLTYTTGARGGRPTTWDCRAVMMSEKERLQHGVRGNLIAWKFMGETDPEITEEDQLDFEFVPGDQHIVKVLTPSRARSTDAAFYRVFGQKDTTES